MSLLLLSDYLFYFKILLVYLLYVNFTLYAKDNITSMQLLQNTQVYTLVIHA